MPLPTRTYDQVKALAQAKVGGMTIDGDREIRFQSLINAAARNCFDDWNYWPRWIVYAEPRTIARGYINFEENSYKMYGAGTSGVDGLYVENGVADTVAKFSLYDNDSTLTQFELERSTTWQILAGSDNDTFDEDTLIYSNTDTGDTPPLTGWVVETAGTSLSPLLVKLSEMGTVLDVNIGGEPFGSDWDMNKKYFVDASGVRLLDNSRGDLIAYVTYKKNLTDIYGDGEGGTTATIPNEWSEYMARYAARDIQAAELTGGDLQGTIGSTEVERARQDMLFREEAQNSQESIARRIYLATSTTLY